MNIELSIFIFDLSNMLVEDMVAVDIEDLL